jgi:glutathione S-transferase
MQLYDFETPNAQRPCAVARYLDSPVEFVRIDLGRGEQQSPEFLAINPNGKVPALHDGDIKLWESHAIMAYLSHQAGADLWPHDPVEQIDVLRWLNWDTAHFSRHASRIFFENYIKGKFGLGDPVQSEIDDASGYFKQFAGVLDEHLDGRQFLVANRLTIADFAVASFLPNANAAQLPLEEFSQINKWHERMMELPAWRKPFPDLEHAEA